MNYVLVPLEKLDVNKITFGKAKENQYKGINSPLYYKRENKNVPLYIKVKGCVCPFGIKQHTEMYSNKVSGYCLCHSLENNYVEKVKELDKFLINEVYENLPLGELVKKYYLRFSVVMMIMELIVSINEF